MGHTLNKTYADAFTLTFDEGTSLAEMLQEAGMLSRMAGYRPCDLHLTPNWHALYVERIEQVWEYAHAGQGDVAPRFLSGTLAAHVSRADNYLVGYRNNPANPRERDLALFVLRCERLAEEPVLTALPTLPPEVAA